MAPPIFCFLSLTASWWEAGFSTWAASHREGRQPSSPRPSSSSTMNTLTNPALMMLLRILEYLLLRILEYLRNLEILFKLSKRVTCECSLLYCALILCPFMHLFKLPLGQIKWFESLTWKHCHLFLDRRVRISFSFQTFTHPNITKLSQEFKEVQYGKWW